MVNLEQLIGKNIIRTVPCECKYGKDYSYCLNGLYGKQSDHWVTVIGISRNNEIAYRDHGKPFDLKIRHLESCWNDGNWVEYNPVRQEIITSHIPTREEVFIQERFGRFDGII